MLIFVLEVHNCAPLHFLLIFRILWYMGWGRNRQCRFLTWYLELTHSFQKLMRKYVLMTLQSVISSRIASVILEFKKSEVVWNEDFLSILKPAEITICCCSSVELCSENRAYSSKALEIHLFYKLKSEFYFCKEFWSFQGSMYINSFKNRCYGINNFQNVYSRRSFFYHHNRKTSFDPFFDVIRRLRVLQYVAVGYILFRKQYFWILAV